ncbi:hypothetical protein J6590_017634, partial [Homalodisca vitripennis]
LLGCDSCTLKQQVHRLQENKRMPTETLQLNRKWLDFTTSMDSKPCWRGREQKGRCPRETVLLSIIHSSNSPTILLRWYSTILSASGKHLDKHTQQTSQHREELGKDVDSPIPRNLPRSVAVAALQPPPTTIIWEPICIDAVCTLYQYPRMDAAHLPQCPP